MSVYGPITCAVCGEPYTRRQCVNPSCEEGQKTVRQVVDLLDNWRFGQAVVATINQSERNYRLMLRFPCDNAYAQWGLIHLVEQGVLHSPEDLAPIQQLTANELLELMRATKGFGPTALIQLAKHCLERQVQPQPYRGDSPSVFQALKMRASSERLLKRHDMLNLSLAEAAIHLREKPLAGGHDSKRLRDLLLALTWLGF